MSGFLLKNFAVSDIFCNFAAFLRNVRINMLKKK